MSPLIIKNSNKDASAHFHSNALNNNEIELRTGKKERIMKVGKYFASHSLKLGHACLYSIKLIYPLSFISSAGKCERAQIIE
jgi:hypothetical protein